MAIQSFVTPLFLFSFLVGSALGGVLLSDLPQTVEVNTSTQEHGEIFQAGEDKLTVTWRTFPGAADGKYKMVKFKLCFAPISQHSRPWRKAKDDITEDKSCKTDLASIPYTTNNIEETFHWMIEKDVPTATYFIRAYALNATDKEVAYGQSTDDHKTINLFKIKGISGRLSSLNIMAACLVAFSLVSICGFLMFEKWKTRSRSRSRITASENQQ